MSTAPLGFVHFPFLRFKVMKLLVTLVYSILLAILPLVIWVSQAGEYRYCIFFDVSHRVVYYIIVIYRKM
jgi:hypothetical protein